MFQQNYRGTPLVSSPVPGVSISTIGVQPPYTFKYSIIPYSSIIFWLFLRTDRLSKSYLSSRISSAIKSAQNSCLCYFCKKEGTSLSMLLCSFLWLCQANNGLKSCQYYNEIMEMDRVSTCKYARVQDGK